MPHVVLFDTRGSFEKERATGSCACFALQLSCAALTPTFFPIHARDLRCHTYFGTCRCVFVLPPRWPYPLRFDALVVSVAASLFHVEVAGEAGRIYAGIECRRSQREEKALTRKVQILVG